MGHPRIAGARRPRAAVDQPAGRCPAVAVGRLRQHRRSRARRRQGGALAPGADHPEPGRRHRRGNPGQARPGGRGRPDPAQDRLHPLRLAGREQRRVPVAAGQVGAPEGAGDRRALRRARGSAQAGAQPDRNGAQRLAGAHQRAERHRQRRPRAAQATPGRTARNHCQARPGLGQLRPDLARAAGDPSAAQERRRVRGGPAACSATWLATAANRKAPRPRSTASRPPSRKPRARSRNRS